MATLTYGSRALVHGVAVSADASPAHASTPIAAGVDQTADRASVSMRDSVFALGLVFLLLLALLSEVAVVGGVTLAFNTISKMCHEAIFRRYEMQKAAFAADEDGANSRNRVSAKAGSVKVSKTRSSSAPDTPSIHQDKVALDCMVNAHACN